MIQKKKFASVLVPRDPKYNSRLVTVLVSRVLKSGKRQLAQKIVYRALKIIAVGQVGGNELLVLNKAIRNACPKVGLVSSRVKKKVFYFPFDIKLFKGLRLAVKWIVEAARTRRGRSMSRKLASAIVSAYRRRGEAIRSKYRLQARAHAYQAFKRKRKWWWKKSVETPKKILKSRFTPKTF